MTLTIAQRRSWARQGRADIDRAIAAALAERAAVEVARESERRAVAAARRVAAAKGGAA